MQYQRTIKIIILLAIPGILLAISMYQPDKVVSEEKNTVAASYEPVAVVELFTSQGCSSCPPADRLLSTIVDEAASQDQQIFALSFHVAYWNHLGWKDPFSREAFSSRQRQYAQTLSQQVYTPQMIVNGTSVFVGSKAQRAKAEIDKALQQSATHRIQLKPKIADNQQSLLINYAVEGSKEDKQLQIALVERGLEVAVQRGENGGRTLHHDNVVRGFTSVALAAQSTGEAQLSLPKDMQQDETSLIAYVQDAETLVISGAVQVKFPFMGIGQK